MPAVLTLPAHNASDWTGPTGNNTYLFTGSHPVLVDAGVGHAAHVATIEGALDGAALEAVLITHGHPDHLSGAALIARWPQLRVLKMPPNLPAGARPLAEGDRIEAGTGSLVVVATPGHSPDHCCSSTRRAETCMRRPRADRRDDRDLADAGR